eukprot:Gb_33530 [translate_table: standard]
MLGEETEPKECCICGDVGFREDLVQCKTCGFRTQHTYCSSLYPNLDFNHWACEWCLYEDHQSSMTRACKSGSTGTRHHSSDSRNSVFEFLVEIAEASPQQTVGGRTVEKGPINCSCKRGNRVYCGHGDIKQDNGDRYFNDETGPKDTPMVDEPETDRHCADLHKQAQSGFKRHQISKKQRCNNPSSKKLKRIGRWGDVGRNKLRDCSMPRTSGRRYKLLADVIFYAIQGMLRDVVRRFRWFDERSLTKTKPWFQF